MASRQRSVRRHHDNRLRKLLTEQEHVEFGWCTSADDAENVLKWLFANKRSWAEARGLRTAYLMTHELRDSCIALARRVDLRAIPLVTYIKVAGTPIAASFNLVGPKVVEFFIVTYDKAFNPYSAGILLLSYTARWAYENGRDFDMRYVHVDYKAQWANHTVICRRYTVFLARNSVAAAAPLAGLAAGKIYRFCRRRLRKIIRRLTGIAGRFPVPGMRQALQRPARPAS
jgi:CelD/BcsL family acetyltransferase involved in cellulose biosynthesis